MTTYEFISQQKLVLLGVFVMLFPFVLESQINDLAETPAEFNQVIEALRSSDANEQQIQRASELLEQQSESVNGLRDIAMQFSLLIKGGGACIVVSTVVTIVVRRKLENWASKKTRP